MEASCSSLSTMDQQETTVREEEDKEDDGPCWANLLPDALAQIFTHLHFKDVLMTLPLVCRAWLHASHNAVCWQNVDLSEWSLCEPKTFERILSLVIHRSQGGLRAIYAPHLRNDEMLDIISAGGSKLQVLQMPNSQVSESCMIHVAPMFPSLKFLDISGGFLSSAVIEALGKNCRCIVRLNVNMQSFTFDSSGCKLMSDDTASAIGQHMPQLKHLEMAYGPWSNKGLSALLENCKSLEHLDLRGCWNVNVEESFLQDAMKGLKVFYPPVVEDDFYDVVYSEEGLFGDQGSCDEDMSYDSLYDGMDYDVTSICDDGYDDELHLWP